MIERRNSTHLIRDHHYVHCWMLKLKWRNRIHRTTLFDHHWSLNWWRSSTSMRHNHHNYNHRSHHHHHWPRHTTNLFTQTTRNTLSFFPSTYPDLDDPKEMTVERIVEGTRSLTSLIPLTIAFIVAWRGPSTVFPSSTGPGKFPRVSREHHRRFSLPQEAE